MSTKDTSTTTNWPNGRPQYYVPDEACEIARISKKTLYRLIRSGGIRAVKFGSQLRIPAEEIHRYTGEEAGR